MRTARPGPPPGIDWRRLKSSDFGGYQIRCSFRLVGAGALVIRVRVLSMGPPLDGASVRVSGGMPCCRTAFDCGLAFLDAAGRAQWCVPVPVVRGWWLVRVQVAVDSVLDGATFNWWCPSGSSAKLRQVDR